MISDNLNGVKSDIRGELYHKALAMEKMAKK